MLQSIVHGQMNKIKVAMNARFGSKADIASIKRDVRFTPESGHWFSTIMMSALCQKQTFCTAARGLFDHLVGALLQK
jgi:hypothetical protein